MRCLHLLAATIALTLLAACASPPRPAPALQAIDRHLQTGSRLYQAGQIAEAKTAFLRAVHAAEMIDDNRRLVDALLAGGSSQLLLGDFAAAEQDYHRAQRVANAEGLPEQAVQAGIALAETARQRGDTTQAIGLFRAARGQAGLTHHQHQQVENGLALCLMAGGDLETAESILLSLETAAGETPTALHASTLANLARLRLRQGQLALAETLAGRALQMDRQLLHPPSIAADHALLGELLQMAGRPEEAQHHRDTANRIFRQTGQAMIGVR